MEPTISIPLSWFEGATELTAQGITGFFEAARDDAQRAEQMKEKFKQLVMRVSGFQNDLRRILDSDTDEFRKLQALRQLQTMMNQLVREFTQ